MALSKNQFSSFLAAIVLAGLVLSGTAGLAQTQNPTWQFAAQFVNTQEVYPVSVEVLSTLDPPPESGVLAGSVRSAEAGCLVKEYPCPVGQTKTINCSYPAKDTDVCAAYFRGGTMVTLRPVANYGTIFAGWYSIWRQYSGINSRNKRTGDIESWEKYHPVQSIGTYQFMVSNYPEENAVKAFFAPRGQRFFINFTLLGGPDAAGARIWSTPSGIDCWIEDDGTSAGVCSADFQVATTVRLNVTPGAFRKFLWWMSGGLFEDCEGVGACKIFIIYPYGTPYNPLE